MKRPDPRRGWMAIASLVACALWGCTASSSTSAQDASSAVVSPTLTPQQLRQQPDVSIPFSEQTWARGMRRYLYVAVIPKPSDVCQNYGFRSKMTMLVAYQTDCSSFSGSRRNDLFFYVAVRNVAGSPGRFDLQNFTLRSQDGQTFEAAPAGPQAPADLLPDSARLKPRSSVFGYVTFDADATQVVPASLNYRDGAQTLTVTFDGEPARAT